MLFPTEDPNSIFVDAIALIAAIVFLVMIALVARLAFSKRTVSAAKTLFEPRPAEEASTNNDIDIPAKEREVVYRSPVSGLNLLAAFIAGVCVTVGIGWIRSRLIKNHRSQPHGESINAK